MGVGCIFLITFMWHIPIQVNQGFYSQNGMFRNAYPSTSNSMIIVTIIISHSFTFEVYNYQEVEERPRLNYALYLA